MYFCYRQSGSSRTLQLIESFRPPGSAVPRNRVIVSLGTYELPREKWETVARAVAARLAGQMELLPDPSAGACAEWVDEIVRHIDLDRLGRRHHPRATGTAAAHDGRGEVVLNGVLADRIEHGESACLGPYLLGLTAWNRLGMTELLKTLGMNELQVATAAASVIARLVAPGSENRLAAMLSATALPELLGAGILCGTRDRLYRVSDHLMDAQSAIEAHLRRRTASLFGLQRTILLYDLTNTHFEGLCAANPKARRGKNKQKRDDCLQLVVGIVYDSNGFVLTHRSFAGNTNDATTVPQMAECLRNALAIESAGDVSPLVILDGGLATTDNLAGLRACGFSYLVNDSRRGRSAWAEQFREGDFESVPGRDPEQTVVVRTMDLPGPLNERVLLCRSQGRELKERAIYSRAEERFLHDLQMLQRRVAGGRLQQRPAIQRAIGRLLERHSRVGRFYRVDLLPGTPCQLEWHRAEDAVAQQDALFGCYVLRTDRRDLAGPDLWELYMTLCRAEEAFRAMKSELGLRPNYHQTELRVDAHVFITVLAYQLQRFILQTLQQAGDHRSWTTIRGILQSHCYATVTLPTRSGVLHRVRKPGQPEMRHWEIYRHFAITTMRHLPRHHQTLVMSYRDDSRNL